MQIDYDFKSLEREAQRLWETEKRFEAQAKPGTEKYYCIPMIPYPSGALHMGHVRNYTLSDVDARFQRLCGKAVLHAIGWDSFGLPAENAAIERECSPLAWTEKNIAQMKLQLQALGLSFDWRRELTTHHPEYYQFEQRFFIEWFKKGWVYRKKTWVNWCPQDQTVLANEQLTEEGQCWRCGTQVVQKQLESWFIHLRDQAEALLEGLNHLPEWPDEVKQMQSHWIGRSEVLQLQLPTQRGEPLWVDLHHPKSMEEVDFWVMSPHHPYLQKEIKAHPELAKSLKSLLLTPSSRPQEAGGFPLSTQMQHPDGNWLPIWVTEGVVTFEEGGSQLAAASIRTQTAAQIFAQRFQIAPRPSSEASETSVKTLKKRYPHRDAVLYRLKDWGISRQRYWGSPIPMLEDKQGQVLPELAQNCPVILPELKAPLKLGANPLENETHWREVKRNGKTYWRVPETFDTFFESSWYYLRYTTPPEHTETTLVAEGLRAWLPVDHYIGGIEHATMHLLYLRFCHKIFKAMGWVNTDEPVKRMTCQGLVLHDAFYRQEGHQKVWVPPQSVTPVRNPQGQILYALDEQQQRVEYAGACKMSKSKKNGVEPQELLERYGADAVRLYVLFAAPPKAQLHWQGAGLQGATRFLKKIWQYSQELHHQLERGHRYPQPSLQASGKLRPHLESCLAQVHASYGEKFLINVAIAALMSGINQWSKAWKCKKCSLEEAAHGLGCLIQWLHPVAPHITSIIWRHLFEGELESCLWPQPSDPRAHLKSEALVIQLNGKKIMTWPHSAASATAESLLEELKKNPTFCAKLKGRTVFQNHFVPQRVLNCITGPTEVS